MEPLTKKQLKILRFIQAYINAKRHSPTLIEIQRQFRFKAIGTVQDYVQALVRKGYVRRAVAGRWNGLEVVAEQGAAAGMSEGGSGLGLGLGRAAVPAFGTASLCWLPLVGHVAAGRPIENFAVLQAGRWRDADPASSTGVGQDSGEDGGQFQNVFADESFRRVEVPGRLLSSGRAVAGRTAAHAIHFVLQVVGDSMIEEGILEGDHVVVRHLSDVGQVRQGQIVVAQVRGEATIKKFYRTKAGFELHSANPKYAPLCIDAQTPFGVVGVFCGLVRQAR